MSTKSTNVQIKHASSLIFVVLVLVVAMWLIGAIFHPVNIVNQAQYVWRVLIQVALFGVFSGVLIFVFFGLIMHYPVHQMLGDLRRLNHPSGLENISRGFILLGLLVIAGQIIGWPTASGTNWFSLYMYELLTKGSLGLLLATGATIVGSWTVGVRTLDEFAVYMFRPENNQVVLVIMGLMNILVFVAMR